MQGKTSNRKRRGSKNFMGNVSKVNEVVRSFKQIDNIIEMKKAIKIDFMFLEEIFVSQFTPYNQDEALIIQQFRKEPMIDIIKLFIIYAVFYDKEEGFKGKEELFNTLREDIRKIYRRIISDLVGKVKEFLKVLLMISYFVFYSLIFFNFYELNANKLSFCVFCFEIVHYEINGFNINPNALKKIITSRLGSGYKVPLKKISMVNITVPSSDFDKAFRKSVIGSHRNLGSEDIQMSHFKQQIENKTAYIKNSCKNTVIAFKEDIEKFKQSRNKSFEIQHLKFRKMKKEKHRKCIDKSSDKLVKERLNINSISHGLLNNTFNPKRNHYISRLIRHPQRRLRYKRGAYQTEVSQFYPEEDKRV